MLTRHWEPENRQRRVNSVILYCWTKWTTPKSVNYWVVGRHKNISIASFYVLQSIRSPAHPQDMQTSIFWAGPEPGTRESCGRKGIWHKNTLGCMAGLTVTLICVATAGQLVVIQWAVWMIWKQRLTNVVTKSRIGKNKGSLGSSSFFQLSPGSP